MLAATVEICGWMGGITLVFAYAIVSSGRITARGRIFQWLNIAGSLMLSANSGWHHAWPSVALNLVWIGVGASALARSLRRKALHTASNS